MENIAIGKIGKIIEGKNEGMYIRFEQTGKGGYSVLYSRKADLGSGGEGFDEWILEENLQKYVELNKFKIEWQE